MQAISKLVLGTVQFGLNYGVNNKLGQMSVPDAHKILDLALNVGIRTLDTAAAYGSSEQVIGDYIKSKDQNPFNIITKLALKNGKTWESSLENSFRNLGVESIDTLMFHSYRDYLETRGEIQEILVAQKGIKFQKLGVSVYTNEELEAVAPDRNIDLVQSPFNLLDNHLHRSDALMKCKEHNKQVHTRSAFLQGLFFMKANYIPEKLKPLSKEIEAVKAISEKAGVSIGALALNYALSKPYIDGVLIGVDSLKQLEQNLQWAQTQNLESYFEMIDNLMVQETALLNPVNWS
ncbi:aldo/keto reductase [Roseivirga sp.]|uniref:aldo/keto reductase n=1 Tax=Roseivirga sp. TaxID=1964215 RepID=UPI002B27B7AC|nr:aldo/keto reductase [Roseivirga sp.]